MLKLRRYPWTNIFRAAVSPACPRAALRLSPPSSPLSLFASVSGVVTPNFLQAIKNQMTSMDMHACCCCGDKKKAPSQPACSQMRHFNYSAGLRWRYLPRTTSPHTPLPILSILLLTLTVKEAGSLRTFLEQKDFFLKGPIIVVSRRFMTRCEWFVRVFFFFFLKKCAHQAWFFFLSFLGGKPGEAHSLQGASRRLLACLFICG